jgi:microsomal epoxide hydrolase
MTPFTPSKKRSPIGYVQFPKEINRSPRRWVERATGGSVVHWSDVSKGGHFAAMEQPQVLVKDVRKFFERVTQGTPK